MVFPLASSIALGLALWQVNGALADSNTTTSGPLLYGHTGAPNSSEVPVVFPGQSPYPVDLGLGVKRNFSTTFYFPLFPSEEQERQCLVGLSTTTLTNGQSAEFLGGFAEAYVRGGRTLGVVLMPGKTESSFWTKLFRMTKGRHYVYELPIPKGCMYLDDSNVAYHTSFKNGSIIGVTVRLAPEMFAVYRPSSSPPPPFYIQSPAVNTAFTGVGECLFAREFPEQMGLWSSAVYVEASMLSLRVVSSTAGPLALVAAFEFPPSCLPTKYRDIAYWISHSTVSRGFLLLVHVGGEHTNQAPDTPMGIPASRSYSNFYGSFNYSTPGFVTS